MRQAVADHARPDLDNLRHAQRAMSAVHLLARLDGEAAGCGMSWIFPGMTAAPFLWADASVVPGYRRRGIGEALLQDVSARGRDPELTFLALVGDRVIGVGYLDVIADTGYHSLTGVVRDWRGRGVAQALKRAQIAAALARGHTRLVTESQHENMPMRRLNEKLAYKPSPGVIVFRGPLL